MVINRNEFISDDNLSHESSLIHLLDRIDAESDETDILRHSPYYSQNQFVRLLSSEPGLCIMDLNICNAYTKFSELEIFIQSVNVQHPVSVICLNECWLTKNSDVSMLNIPGYKLFHHIGNVPGHSHCGLIIYVHEQYTCNEIVIDQVCEGWEYMCLEIAHVKPRSKKYIVSNVYRPPEREVQELDTFIEQFYSFLNIIKTMNRSSFVCGDFNLNMLELHNNQRINTYFENMMACSFFPRITLPTRIQPPSFSLIDNILTNDIQYNNISKSGLLINAISDHKIIFTHLANKSYSANDIKYIEIEKRDEASIGNFIEELKSLNLYNELDANLNCSPQNNYELFARLIKYAKNKHLYKKTVKFNKRKHKKSKWITYGILNSINTRDRLYKVFIQCDHEDVELFNRLKAEYMRFRALLRRNIREAKRLYYARTFNLFKNDIKKTWSTINDTLNRKSKTSCSHVHEFDIDNEKISNPDQIANKFNEYFINIGHTLAENIQSNKHYTDFLSQPKIDRFAFSLATENQVIDIIKGLKNKSSYGHDGISNNLIKRARDVLYKPLTLLINQTLTSGIYPTALKISKVKPLLKSGSASNICNYRPISLLSSFSKIFEYVIFHQLFDYLESHNLICCEQFGFRSGHSTELANLKLVNKLIQDMDSQKVPINIYIDLSKAFDTLDHGILLSKLEFYGIHGSELALFSNYLSGRIQYVEYNGATSRSRSVSLGVPQGSILGPLLFLIYINDLPSSTAIFDVLMYADDTTLFCNLNHTVGEAEINMELNNIYTWLLSNKLSLNVKKTKFMVFHHHRKIVEYPSLNINNKAIERVEEFNFLGVIISQDLKWRKHVEHICIKISKVVGIMYRLKHIFPKSILLVLYNTLILPHFHYCLLAWGSKIVDGHRIHLIQKKAIRIISNSHYIAHTEPICKTLNLLKVTDLFRCCLWKFYYKLMNREVPSYFISMLPELPRICEHYNIRRPTFHLPKIRHGFAEQLLQYCLIKLLNSENATILIVSKVHTHSYFGFKCYVKSSCINAYSDHCTIINCVSCQRRMN